MKIKNLFIGVFLVFIIILSGCQSANYEKEYTNFDAKNDVSIRLEYPKQINSGQKFEMKIYITNKLQNVPITLENIDVVSPAPLWFSSEQGTLKNIIGINILPKDTKVITESMELTPAMKQFDKSKYLNGNLEFEFIVIEPPNSVRGRSEIKENYQINVDYS